MIPYPSMVSLKLVRVKLPPLCCTNALPFASPLLSVTVPPPWSVTLPAMSRLVLLPLPALSCTLPWLVSVPRSVVVVPRGPV